MQTVIVTTPDGRKYRVKAPPGATREEIFAYVDDNLRSSPQAQPEPEPEAPSFGRGLAAGSNMAGAAFGSAVAEAPATLSAGIREKAITQPPLGRFSGMSGLTSEDPNPVDIPPEMGEFATGVRDTFQDVYEAERGVHERARPQDFGPTQVAYDVGTAILQMAPSLTAGYLTRNPNLALSMMTIPSYGQSYQQAKEEGADEATAMQQALVRTAFEIGPEKVFGVWDKLLGKEGFKGFLKAAFAEGGTEVLTEALNKYYDVALGKDVGDSWLDVAKDFGHAGLIGTLTGGAIKAGTGTVNKANEALNKANEAISKRKMDVADPRNWAASLDAEREALGNISRAATTAPEIDQQGRELEAEMNALLKSTPIGARPEVSSRVAPTAFEAKIDQPVAGPSALGTATIDAMTDPSFEPTIEGIESLRERLQDAEDQSRYGQVRPAPYLLDEAVEYDASLHPPSAEAGTNIAAAPDTRTPEEARVDRWRRDFELGQTEWDYGPDAGVEADADARRQKKQQFLENADAKDIWAFNTRGQTKPLSDWRPRRKPNTAWLDIYNNTTGAAKQSMLEAARERALLQTEIDYYSETAKRQAERDRRTRLAWVRGEEIADDVEVIQPTVEQIEDTELLEEATQREPEAASEINAAIPDRFRKKTAGQWEVVGYEPIKGKVYVRWVAMNGSFDMVFTASRPQDVAPVYGLDGTPVRTGSTTKTKPPGLELRHAIAHIVNAYGGTYGNVRGGGRRGKKGGGLAEIPFGGVVSVEQFGRSLAEERLQEARDKAQGGRKRLTPSQEEVITAEAMQDAADFQENMTNVIIESARRRGGNLVEIELPQSPKDKGLKIVNLVEEGAEGRLRRSETPVETVTQVTPDGGTRTVEIRANDKTGEYLAVLVGQNLNQYKDEVTLGPMEEFPLDMGINAKALRIKTEGERARREEEAPEEPTRARRDFGEVSPQLTPAGTRKRKAAETRRRNKKAKEKALKDAQAATTEAARTEAILLGEEDVDALTITETMVQEQEEADVELPALSAEATEALTYEEEQPTQELSFEDEPAAVEVVPPQKGVEAAHAEAVEAVDRLAALIQRKDATAPGEISEKDAQSAIRNIIQSVFMESLQPYAVQHVMLHDRLRGGNDWAEALVQAANPETRVEDFQAEQPYIIPLRSKGGQHQISVRTQQLLDAVERMTFEAAKNGDININDLPQLFANVSFLIEKDAMTQAAGTALDEEARERAVLNLMEGEEVAPTEGRPDTRPLPDPVVEAINSRLLRDTYQSFIHGNASRLGTKVARAQIDAANKMQNILDDILPPPPEDGRTAVENRTAELRLAVQKLATLDYSTSTEKDWNASMQRAMSTLGKDIHAHEQVLTEEAYLKGQEQKRLDAAEARRRRRSPEFKKREDEIRELDENRLRPKRLAQKARNVALRRKAGEDISMAELRELDEGSEYRINTALERSQLDLELAGLIQQAVRPKEETRDRGLEDELAQAERDLLQAEREQVPITIKKGTASRMLETYGPNWKELVNQELEDAQLREDAYQDTRRDVTVDETALLEGPLGPEGAVVTARGASQRPTPEAPRGQPADPRSEEVPTIAEVRAQFELNEENRKKAQAEAKKQQAAAKRKSNRKAKKDSNKRFSYMAQLRDFNRGVWDITKADLAWKGEAWVESSLAETTSSLAAEMVELQKPAALREIELWQRQYIKKNVKDGKAESWTFNPSRLPTSTDGLDLTKPHDIGNRASYEGRQGALQYFNLLEGIRLGANALNENHPNFAKSIRWVTRHISRGGSLTQRGKQKLMMPLLTRMKGRSAYAVRQVADEYAAAMKIMRKDGFKLMSPDVRLAIKGFLNGRSIASLRDEYGVTIPADAADRLRVAMSMLRRMQEYGVDIAAYVQPNVLEAIHPQGEGKVARPYLHHRLKRSVLSQGVLKNMSTKEKKDAIKEISYRIKAAYQVPNNMDRRAAERLSKGQLLRIIRDLPPWSNRLSNFNQRITEDGTRYLITQFDMGGTNLLDVGKTAADGSLSSNKESLIATKDQLVDMVMSQQWTEKTFEQAVIKVLNEFTYEHTNGRTGEKTDTSGINLGALQSRDLLLSDMEMISRTINSVEKSNEGRKTPDLIDQLRKEKKRYLGLSFAQFKEEVVKQYPDMADLLTAKEAHFDMLLAIRNLALEDNNPARLIIDTAQELAAATHMSEFLSQTASVGVSNGWMSIEPKSNWVTLGEKGTPLGEQTFTYPNGQVYAAHQVYVEPQIAEELTQITTMDAKDRHWGLRTVYATAGIQKYGLVVWNPIAHFRNFFSTGYIHASRGGLLDLNSTQMAGRSALGQLRESVSSGSRNRDPKAAIKWLEDKTLEYGLLHDGVRSGAVADVVSKMQVRGENLSTVVFGSDKLENLGTSFGHAGLAGSNLKNPVDTMFRLEDEWVKIAALRTEARNWLKWHHGSAKIFDDAQQGEKLSAAEAGLLDSAFRSAAETVADRYPTFSRAAPWVKSLSRNPIVGAFPTFTYESIRTSLNQWGYIVNLMEGRTPDGKKVKSGKARAQMSARAGMLLANEVVTRGALLGLGALGKDVLINTAAYWLGLLGDEEEDKEKLDTAAEWVDIISGQGVNHDRMGGIVPTWQRGNRVFVTDVDTSAKTAKINDISYLMPEGAVDTQLRIVAQDLLDAANAGDPRMARAVWTSAVDSFMGLFANDEVFLGNAAQRYRRPAEDPYEYEDKAFSRQMGDWAESAYNELIPNTPGEFAGVPGDALGAALENGPWREIVNSIGTTAENYKKITGAENWTTEAGAVVSDIGYKMLGYKQKTYDFYEDFQKNVRADKDNLADKHRSMLNNLAKSDAETYEEFASEYRVYNMYRKRAFEDIHDGILTLSGELRVPNFEIAGELARGGIKESASGLTQEQFFDGGYTPPDPEVFLKDGLGKRDEKFDMDTTRLNQLNSWYNRAYYSTQENDY